MSAIVSSPIDYVHLQMEAFNEGAASVYEEQPIILYRDQKMRSAWWAGRKFEKENDE